MLSSAIVTSEKFNHPVCCWRGGQRSLRLLAKKLIAKSIKCWLLLVPLPIVNKWFWQCIQTGKSIPEGFSVALGFCIHVNMGSGFLHTSERDYLSPLEACPCAEEDASLSLSLPPPAGRWYLNITYFNTTYANISQFFWLPTLHVSVGGNKNLCFDNWVFMQNNCCTFSGSCLKGFRWFDQW